MLYLRGDRFFERRLQTNMRSIVDFFEKLIGLARFWNRTVNELFFDLWKRTSLVKRPTVNPVSVRGIVFGTRTRKITQRTSRQPFEMFIAK